MKKMIIASIAMLLCVAANAAQINWSSQTKIDYTKSIAGDAAGHNALGLFVLVNTDGNIVANAGVITGGGPAASNKVLGSYVWTYGEAGTPSNGDIFTVMFQLTDLSLLEVRFSDESALPTFTISGLEDNTYGGDYNFAPTASGTFYVVPEPTSMALLALGIAALGLRRRR